MDSLILVFYLNVGNMEGLEMEKFIHSVTKSMFSEETMKKIGATTFVIPVRNTDSRIECINPNYIVDENLYAIHQTKLKELNDHFDNFIKSKKNGE